MSRVSVTSLVGVSSFGLNKLLFVREQKFFTPEILDHGPNQHIIALYCVRVGFTFLFEPADIPTSCCHLTSTYTWHVFSLAGSNLSMWKKKMINMFFFCHFNIIIVLPAKWKCPLIKHIRTLRLQAKSFEDCLRGFWASSAFFFSSNV